jgi:hypothetical protein
MISITNVLHSLECWPAISLTRKPSHKQKELAASTSHYGPQGIALSQAMAVKTII